jgi:hypothetical protein
MAVYRFERTHIRSIGLERQNNYLILVTRVAKSEERFEPASGRSEKRIVSEYTRFLTCMVFLIPSGLKYMTWTSKKKYSTIHLAKV